MTDDEQEESALESWKDWVIRTTHTAEEAAKLAGVKDWVSEQARRKWTLAGHIARRTDGRWSHRVLTYRPVGGTRAQGHPCRRWEDELDEFVSQKMQLPQGFWKSIAAQRERWASFTEEFVQMCVV
eukprot:4551307-Karenia_brevis.AAC.1